MAREAGWAKREKNRIFDAALPALRDAGLPADPLPNSYERTRILVLAGPKKWLRYFIWAEPSRDRLAAGVYVPKGKYGEAVNAVLLKDQEALARSLGGRIRQHKEVQREFRHYVRCKHLYKTATVGDAVQWCVEKVRAAHGFVEASPTLLTSKALRAALDELKKPTDDPALFEARVRALLGSEDAQEPPGNEAPLRKVSSPGERFVRCPLVAAWVRRRARGRCESCDQRAPFEKDDGTPFLEIHHLTRLADKGADKVSNTVAVCPNCHRRLHHGRDREKVTARIRERLFPL